MNDKIINRFSFSRLNNSFKTGELRNQGLLNWKDYRNTVKFESTCWWEIIYFFPLEFSFSQDLMYFMFFEVFKEQKEQPNISSSNLTFSMKPLLLHLYDFVQGCPLCLIGIGNAIFKHLFTYMSNHVDYRMW